MQRIWQPRAAGAALKSSVRSGAVVAGARLRATNPVLPPKYGPAVAARRALHAALPTRSAQVSDFTIAPTERIAVEIDGGIATVTLQDQKTRNCLSTAMMKEIVGVIERLESNPAIKVMILTHTGKVFSSGHNLKELQLTQETTGNTSSIFDTCNVLMLKVRSTRLPIVASVSGFATAAGCQLVATADLCVCSEESSFSTPGVNIGLFCHTPGVALGRAVGPKAAMAMLLTGDIMTSQKALDFGLVNEIVPAEKLAAHTKDLASRIAKAPSAVIALGKETFYRQMAHGELASAYAFAGAHQRFVTSDNGRCQHGVMSENMRYDDAKEGLGAFIEKRPPVWKS